MSRCIYFKKATRAGNMPPKHWPAAILQYTAAAAAAAAAAGAV